MKLEDAERVALELEDDALGWYKEAAALLRKIPELHQQVSQRWLPIDDAPSNVKLLLFGPHGIECGYASHGWPRNSQGISNMSYHGSATHWQPLPEGHKP